MSGFRNRSTATKAVALSAAALAVVGLAACGSSKGKSGNNNNTKSASMTVGTTDSLVSLDPAGSYDFGSLMLETNVYQFLMNVPAGEKAPKPDAAESCSFTSGTEYTCKIKSGIKFSNGDSLTANDVAFSFNRVVKINDPNGPASLLGNMASVKAKDDSTVVFTLKNPNDQTFPFVLGTSAGPIVDSKVFPPDKLLDDAKAIGSGPYAVTSYSKNQLVQLKANSNYSGPNTPKTNTIVLKYYTSAQNMKQDIQKGAIDAALRTLAPSDVSSLKNDKNVKVLTGSGGELRYIVFNLKTMPGNTEAQKLAVRQAVAYSIDRQAIADKVFQGTYQPAYSMVPQGIAGATEPFKDAYGATPDKAKAQQVLTAAGVSTPIKLHIQYDIGHYGPVSDQEYTEIKRQLDSTGLFNTTIQATEHTTYVKERVADVYPAYQLGWFPDFVDADNYLFNFLSEANFIHAHYCDVDKTSGKPVSNDRPCDKDGVLPLLTTEETKTGGDRDAALTQIQKVLATGTMPYLPLFSGEQVAVVRPSVTGVQETLDATYQYRFWLFSKS